MLRFLHTADLQIGMTAPGVGPMAQRVQEARIESLQTILKLGAEKQVQFVVIAGDLFETNHVSRRLVERVAHIFRSASVPVFLIAGNHDYCGVGSVYASEEFQKAGPHVRVFQERRPVIVPEMDVTIYPCSCFETRSAESPVAWIQKQNGTTYHICIAHGSLPDRAPVNEYDYPMSVMELKNLQMDYIALGHWHSVHPDPAQDQNSPFFYSGTPEPTKFGERQSGYALLVELEEGQRTVSVIPTGKYRYVDIAREIVTPSDIETLRRELEGMPALENILVRLLLSGVVSMDIREKLDRLAREVEERVAFARVVDDSLSLEPTDEDLHRFPKNGIAYTSLQQLQSKRDMAPAEDRLVYSRAIALAYRAFSER